MSNVDFTELLNLIDKTPIPQRPRNARSRRTDDQRSYQKTPETILEALENIVNLVEDSSLSDEFFKSASKSIKYAVSRLKMTEMQVVLLSIFVDKSNDPHISLSEIAVHLDCKTIRIMRLLNDIDELEKRRYVRSSISLGGRKTYMVPMEVLETLRKDEPYVYVPTPLTDTQSFFDRFHNLMNDKRAHRISHDYLRDLTLQSLAEIKATGFARAVAGYKLSDEDTLLFIFMAYLFVEKNDNNITFSDIEDIFDNGMISMECRSQLRKRTSDLFKKSLIENVNEEGLGDRNVFRLSDKAKEEVLGELDIAKPVSSKQGLICSDSIVKKDLIYNAVEERQLIQLTSLFSPVRFNEVQSRLRDSGMRSGFCCIFYGTPGTGKTETVYQIARQTGRDIMQVDVARIKSCWVGDTEKNIRLLFKRYRDICKTSEVAPILLFNEADAILGTRLEGASRAVDKMENSLQNIILQEMEELDGILIATTNLTGNLDKAFERRFLYKVKFEKPSEKARAAIWRMMLPKISEEDCDVLASQFDFSGGEIENIARNHIVSSILNGSDELDLDRLLEACRRERIQSTGKVGFHTASV